jgi:hypothetical protein
MARVLSECWLGGLGRRIWRTHHTAYNLRACRGVGEASDTGRKGPHGSPHTQSASKMAEAVREAITKNISKCALQKCSPLDVGQTLALNKENCNIECRIGSNKTIFVFATLDLKERLIISQRDRG